MNKIAVMRHLISLIVCMMSLTALAAPAAAVPDTLSAGGQGVTLRSDTVIDDTSNYVISTRIPKGITATMACRASRSASSAPSWA